MLKKRKKNLKRKRNLKNLLNSILSAEDKVACAQENAKTKKLRPSPDMMPIIEAANAGDEAALVAALNARMATLDTLDQAFRKLLGETYDYSLAAYNA